MINLTSYMMTKCSKNNSNNDNNCQDPLSIGSRLKKFLQTILHYARSGSKEWTIAFAKMGFSLPVELSPLDVFCLRSLALCTHGWNCQILSKNYKKYCNAKYFLSRLREMKDVRPPWTSLVIFNVSKVDFFVQCSRRIIALTFFCHPHFL